MIVLAHGDKDTQQDRAIWEGKRRREGTFWTHTGRARDIVRG